MTLKIGNVQTNQIDNGYILKVRVTKNKIDRQKELGHFRTGLKESQKRRIRKRDNHMCQICGEFAETIDHIIPWRISHDNSDSNLRVLCTKCNLDVRQTRRDARLPFEEWYKSVKEEQAKLNTIKLMEVVQ